MIFNPGLVLYSILFFVNKYFPTLTNPKQMTISNPAIDRNTNIRMKKSVTLSPAMKQKGSGGEFSTEFCSPSKKIKNLNNFKSKLEYWESKIEIGYSAEPCDKTTRIRKKHSRFGASGGGGGGNIIFNNLHC